jgi:hypothetical protein
MIRTEPVDAEAAPSRARTGALVAAVGLASGAAVYAGSLPITGYREPWDGPVLYYAATTFTAGALSSWVAPRHSVLAVAAVYLGQHLYAYFAHPETRPWLLFGLAMNAVVPTWIFTAAGAVTVRLLARRR